MHLQIIAYTSTILHELNIPTLDDLFGLHTHEPICLGAFTIPQKQAFCALCIKLTLFSSGTMAYAMHPNTRMCEMQGFLPLHASSGVMDGNALDGHRFLVYAAFTTASAQSDFLRF